MNATKKSSASERNYHWFRLQIHFPYYKLQFSSQTVDFNRNRKKLITFRTEINGFVFCSTIFIASHRMFRLSMACSVPIEIDKTSFNIIFLVRSTGKVTWREWFLLEYLFLFTYVTVNRLISLEQSIFLRCDGFRFDCCWIVYMVRWSSRWLLSDLTRKKMCNVATISYAVDTTESYQCTGDIGTAGHILHFYLKAHTHKHT